MTAETLPSLPVTQSEPETCAGPNCAVSSGSPDITALCAALDALVMIELPMRAAMTSAMISQAQYASQIAICEMQRVASLENAAIERRLAEAYARQANNPVTDAEPSTPASTRAQGPRSV